MEIARRLEHRGIRVEHIRWVNAKDLEGLNDFFYDGTKKGIQPKHADKLEFILDHLNAASDISDMNYPGSGLHKLEPRSSDMEKHVWAVTVSGNWRGTFKFFNGDAYIVDYKDYH
jgi:proteic killer suppression protein